MALQEQESYVEERMVEEQPGDFVTRRKLSRTDLDLMMKPQYKFSEGLASGIAAEKYRLSFVDVSDTSSDEDEETQNLFSSDISLRSPENKLGKIDAQTKSGKMSAELADLDLQYDDEEILFLTSQPAVLNSEQEKESHSETDKIISSTVRCMNHTSSSPLYKMSIPQLQHTVDLLQSKLQGIIITTS